MKTNKQFKVFIIALLFCMIKPLLSSQNDNSKGNISKSENPAADTGSAATASESNFTVAKTDYARSKWQMQQFAIPVNCPVTLETAIASNDIQHLFNTLVFLLNKNNKKTKENFDIIKQKVSSNVLHQLLNHADVNGYTLLMHATRAGNVELVQSVCEINSNNIHHNSHETQFDALMIAVTKYQSNNKSIEIVRKLASILLSHGAQVRVVKVYSSPIDFTAISALSQAFAWLDFELIELILKKGKVNFNELKYLDILDSIKLESSNKTKIAAIRKLISDAILEASMAQLMPKFKQQSTAHKKATSKKEKPEVHDHSQPMVIEQQKNEVAIELIEELKKLNIELNPIKNDQTDYSKLTVSQLNNKLRKLRAQKAQADELASKKEPIACAQPNPMPASQESTNAIECRSEKITAVKIPDDSELRKINYAKKQKKIAQKNKKKHTEQSKKDSSNSTATASLMLSSSTSIVKDTSNASKSIAASSNSVQYLQKQAEIDEVKKQILAHTKTVAAKKLSKMAKKEKKEKSKQKKELLSKILTRYKQSKLHDAFDKWQHFVAQKKSAEFIHFFAAACPNSDK